MKKKNRHRLNTISDLVHHLGINQRFLKDLLDDLNSDETRLYRSWDEPKPKGGTRPIDSPREKLKSVQKRINERILQRTQIGKTVTGAVRGRKLKNNLNSHVGQAMVANFDLTSFFSNITNMQVYSMFILVGMSPDVARVLTRLTTFKKRIPQGAPTSPMLANLVAGYGGVRCLDGRLESLCEKNQFRITRWIDDISVSGAPYLERLQPTIEKIIRESNFIPNINKTTLASKDEEQIVTGHLVNKKPNVRKKERRCIRAILHQLRTKGIEGYDQESQGKIKRHLRGKIAHITSINPDSGKKFLQEFNSVKWTITLC